MTEETLPLTIQTVFRTHPALLDWIGAVISVERLGGLTNENQLLRTLNGNFVLRIPGAGTESYINRSWEKHAVLITAQLGVNAPVLFFDAQSGIQLSRFLERAVTMSALGFRDLGAVRRAAKSLRRVHESTTPFLNRFEVFAMIDNYMSLLEAKETVLPHGFHALLKQAASVRIALNHHPVPAVPCHCDPLAENFLDDGLQSYVIDWEYSGNNDPMWDLGDLSVEADFSTVQDEELLAGYFSDNSCRPFDRGRMVLYKAMCDLLWTLWGLLQHAHNNPAEDFQAYAQKRFERCQKLMNSPGFDKHLAAVMDGPCG